MFEIMEEKNEKEEITHVSNFNEKIIISELTLLKLATNEVRSMSYSLGSIILVSVLCMLEKNDVRTVPISKT